MSGKRVSSTEEISDQELRAKRIATERGLLQAGRPSSEPLAFTVPVRPPPVLSVRVDQLTAMADSLKDIIARQQELEALQAEWRQRAAAERERMQRLLEDVLAMKDRGVAGAVAAAGGAEDGSAAASEVNTPAKRRRQDDNSNGG